MLESVDWLIDYLRECKWATYVDLHLPLVLSLDTDGCLRGAASESNTECAT